MNIEQLFSKIRKTDTCWIWLGELSKGYGKIYFNGKNHRAHRLIFEMNGNTIPDGMELDHTCRNRACVNPEHLEIVTHLENMRRASPFRPLKTHCKNGHEFTEDNLAKTYPGYGRVCRTCRNTRRRFYTRIKSSKQAHD